MLKAILIDFDNTLMDTERLVLPSLIERFNQLYQKPNEEQLTYETFVKHFHGATREPLCKRMGEYFQKDVEYNVLFENRESQVSRYFKKTGVEMAPNVIEMLKLLKNRGYILALITNSPLERIFSALRFATNHKGDELAGLFGTLFFESGATPKPSSEVYLKALEQLNLAPEECIAIEDSVNGVLSSCGAKIKTLGYTHYSKNENGLLEHGAKACFADWADFLSIV